MRPRFQVVQATLPTLPSLLCPSPARPHSRGEALPSPAEGFRCLISPQPRCKELSPEAGYRAQAQQTLDGQVGAQLVLPEQERAARAGRSDTTLGTYLLQSSPTFPRGAMPKVPSPTKSQAGEPPRAATSGSSGKVATRLHPSCPTGWTSSRIPGLPRLPPPAAGTKAT